MERDLKALTDTTFDLLVVGAGIYGATAAWDAAQRGLSVAVIDRGDFGGGTSFNSAKTIHGGVRSLQTGDLRALRRFVRERRALTRIAPHLVHPLPFLIPTRRGLARHRLLMRAYFAVSDWIARDRNDLDDPSKHLPASRLLSAAECLRLHPGFDPAGLTGGILWHDCQMYNSDRLTLSFVLSAVHAGAVAANYVEASAGLRTGDRICGISARDVLTDQRFDIRSRIVLNAVGPWARPLLNRIAPTAARAMAPRLSKAMNLVTRPITNHAVGGEAGSRFLFAVPWRGVSIVGTSHDPHDGSADTPLVTRADVERFLTEVNTAFPAAHLSLDDVRLVHRGLLSAEAAGGPGVRLVKESLVRDHRADGAPGVLSVLGVRYTTARDTAEQAVTAVFRVLDRPVPPCQTASTPLQGGDISRFEDYLSTTIRRYSPPLTPDAIRRLVCSYGTQSTPLLDELASSASMPTLGGDGGVTGAEVRHAVRHEMAVTLTDAVLRRTEAGSAGHPGQGVLRAAADIMATELNWSPERTRREIEQADGFYRIADA